MTFRRKVRMTYGHRVCSPTYLRPIYKVLEPHVYNAPIYVDLEKEENRSTLKQALGAQEKSTARTPILT